MRITRDSIIVFVALALGCYEVLAGGGRPAVLTFCVALLGSPLVVRLDEYRRAARATREVPGDHLHGE